MIEKIIDFYENRDYENKLLNKILIPRLENIEIRKSLMQYMNVISLYTKKDDMESYKELIGKMLEYDDLIEDFKEKWLIIANNCENGIELIEVFAQHPEIRDIMQKNADGILRYSNWEDISELVHGFECIDDNARIITPYLNQMLIEDAISFSQEKLLAESIINYNGLDRKDEYIDKIIAGSDKYEQITEIINLCKGTEAQSIYDKHKGVMTLYEASKANRFIQLKKLPEEIIGKIVKSKRLEDEINGIVEAAENGDVSIISHGEGRHSLTYDINGKHLKLGIGINNFNIKRNHRRFLQPHIRKQIDGIFIEVYETHDNEHDNITDEELLQVFEELYRDGLVWEDAKKENLVRLKEDNVTPGYVRQRDDTIYGFQEHTEKLEVLKKGEVAICDLDYIYSMDDPEYKSGKYKRGLVPPKIIALKRRLDKEFEERERKNGNEGR